MVMVGFDGRPIGYTQLTVSFSSRLPQRVCVCVCARFLPASDTKHVYALTCLPRLRPFRAGRSRGQHPREARGRRAHDQGGRVRKNWRTTSRCEIRPMRPPVLSGKPAENLKCQALIRNPRNRGNLLVSCGRWIRHWERFADPGSGQPTRMCHNRALALQSWFRRSSRWAFVAARRHDQEEAILLAPAAQVESLCGGSI